MYRDKKYPFRVFDFYTFSGFIPSNTICKKPAKTLIFIFSVCFLYGKKRQQYLQISNAKLGRFRRLQIKQAFYGFVIKKSVLFKIRCFQGVFPLCSVICQFMLKSRSKSILWVLQGVFDVCFSAMQTISLRMQIIFIAYPFRIFGKFVGVKKCRG